MTRLDLDTHIRYSATKETLDGELLLHLPKSIAFTLEGKKLKSREFEFLLKRKGEVVVHVDSQSRSSRMSEREKAGMLVLRAVTVPLREVMTGFRSGEYTLSRFAEREMQAELSADFKGVISLELSNKQLGWFALIKKQ